MPRPHSLYLPQHFYVLLLMFSLVVFLSLFALTNAAETQIQDEVYSVAWSPDGTMIAASGGIAGCSTTALTDFAIRILDATTGETAKYLLGMTCTSTGLDWSPDGTKLVSFNIAQSVGYIWDMLSGELLSTVPLNTQGMLSAEWSPNGDLIASGTPGNSIILWNPTTGGRLSDVPGTMLDWSPDGKRLVTGTIYGNEIDIQDAETGELLAAFSGATDAPYSVDWSPDASRTVSASRDNTVRIWNVTDGQVLLALTIPNVVDARWSPDSQWLATASLEGLVQVWDANTGLELGRFRSRGRVYAVDWSPDGTELVYGGETGTVKIVQVPDTTP